MEPSAVFRCRWWTAAVLVWAVVFAGCGPDKTTSQTDEVTVTPTQTSNPTLKPAPPDVPDPPPPFDPNALPPFDPNALPPVDPNALPPVDPNALPPVDPNALPPVDPNALPPVDPNALPPVDPNALPPADPNVLPPVDPNALPPVDPSAVSPTDPPPIEPVDLGPDVPIDPIPIPAIPEDLKPPDPPTAPGDVSPEATDPPVAPNPVIPPDPIPEPRVEEPLAEEPPDLGPPLVDSPKNLTRLNPIKPLWIDTKAKRVVMVGEICQTDVPLEFFACLKDTKEHEAIVTVDVLAYEAHAGLLALGAKVGAPVRWHPTYQAATGCEVEVTVSYKDDQGRVKTVRAQEWILDTSTGKPMAHQWVFAGSRFRDDPLANTRVYEAEGGEFVCVSNFSTAMLDLAIESSQTDTNLLFKAFTERIPPRGTPITLVLTPKLKAAEPEKKSGDAVEKTSDAVEEPDAPVEKPDNPEKIE